MIKTYNILCHLAAVESGFAPSCLNEDVCRERLLDRVYFSQLHEHNLHVHRSLQSHRNIKLTVMPKISYTAVSMSVSFAAITTSLKVNTLCMLMHIFVGALQAKSDPYCRATFSVAVSLRLSAVSCIFRR